MLKSLDNVGRLTWATKVSNLFFRYGYGTVWISQTVGDSNHVIKHFKQRLTERAKFRCSSHKFKIETGRHRNIPRQDRFCEFCFQRNGLRVTGDELHVFFNCPKFESCWSNMLLTWCDKGDSPNDLYDILQTQCPRKLKSLAIYISELLRLADD